MARSLTAKESYVKVAHKMNGRDCHMFSIKGSVLASVQAKSRPLMAEDVMMPDGTSPERFSEIRCGSCGFRLMNHKDIYMVK